MLRLIASTVLACALLAYACTVADARPKQTRTDSGKASQCIYDNTARIVCPGSTGRIQRLPVASREGVVIVGRRPPGCPYKYCGCEASLYKFGKIYPELNLAYNWIRKFPRTSPAPGMAAARRGHVMILVIHVSGDDWLVHDGNSGGGLTRRHVRSIKRYVVVNPDAVKVASR